MSDKEQTIRDVDSSLGQFTAQMADGRQIAVDAHDEESARRLAREQGGGIGVLNIEQVSAPRDEDADDDERNNVDPLGTEANAEAIEETAERTGYAPPTELPTGEPGETTPSGPVTGEPGSNVQDAGTFAAPPSGGNAGVGGGSVATDADGDGDADNGGNLPS